jgi:ParB family chromosome partitioning protein
LKRRVTVAHHLALLELPPPLDAALRSGRCAAPRTLYELNKIHAERPQAVLELLNADGPITREAVAALRKPLRTTPKRAADARKTPPAKPFEARQFVKRADQLCTQLAAVCSQLRGAGFEQVPADELDALRTRMRGLKVLLEP